MMRGIGWVFASLATAGAAWMGCSSTVASATGGAGSTSRASSAKSSSTGAGGSGGGGSTASGITPPIPFECTVPATAPSLGSCVVIDADAGTNVPDGGDGGPGIQCNPITNEGCPATQVCDSSEDSTGVVTGFMCFSGNGTAATCAPCNDNGPATTCAPGGTCFTYDGEISVAACARYCCTNADCGSGLCTTIDSSDISLYGPLAPMVGVCIPM